jgi:hypothetical protein
MIIVCIFVMLYIYRNFGPKREKLTGVSGKLYNYKLGDFDSAPDIIWVIKEDKVGRTCDTHLGKNMVEKREVSFLF